MNTLKRLELYRRLLREADELRHEDPKQALLLATNVRDLAAALDRQQLGWPRWLSLQAETWAVVGSALRSVADLRQAESAFNVAIAFLDAPQLRGRLDPFAHPRLAQRAAYLRCDQGRFDEALELIDEAIAGYSRLDLCQHRAAALVVRGLIVGRWGRKEEAVVYLSKALEDIDPQRNWRNFLAAVHNMALYHHELAVTPAANRLALRWLQLACRCHARMPESINVLKLRTLHALTAIRLGRIDEGISELWIAQDGFKQRGAVYEQATLLLHLAASYQAQGRTSAVKRVAGQLFPIFRSIEVSREALAALMLFYNAAQAENATLGLIERVSALLSQARRDDP